MLLHKVFVIKMNSYFSRMVENVFYFPNIIYKARSGSGGKNFGSAFSKTFRKRSDSDLQRWLQFRKLFLTTQFIAEWISHSWPFTATWLTVYPRFKGTVPRDFLIYFFLHQSASSGHLIHWLQAFHNCLKILRAL